MIDLDSLVLAKGCHGSRESGVCLMEAVAWWAGKEHTDAPPCVSRVLRDFGIALNDRLPDERRQELIPLIPLLPGTAGDGKDGVRGYMALDWLVRTYTPAWLELGGLTEAAAELRALRRIADMATAGTAGPVVRSAGDAARDAAGDAARDAAGAAARAAAGDAARAAAGDAAGAAAGDAARAAARAAAGDAAWAAAWAAARAAAWAAARAAAGDDAGDAAWDAAWAAAWAAAGDVLKPTVEILQVSAIGLFRDMIRGEWA